MFQVNKLSIFVALFLIPLFAFAAPKADPVETVNELVASMKSNGGFKGMLEHVHWPTALQNMDDEQRAAMGVKTPQDLKKVTLKFLEDPAKAFYERMSPRMKDMPEKTRKLTEDFIVMQQERLTQKLRAAEKRMVNSEYAVGKAVVDGDKASVQLTATYEGVSKERMIKLQKIDGLWYLPTSDLTGLDDAQVQGQK